MKRRNGRVELEFPDDYHEFTHARVHFVRETGLHERGRYRVTALASGRFYTVTGGHSKRYPWVAEAVVGLDTPYARNYRNVGAFSTLVDAAEAIAYWDATMYREYPMHEPARTAPTPATTEGAHP